MTDRQTLKPAEGRLVRHPGSYKPLAAEGEAVEMSSYWTRKVRAGDVVVVKAEAGQKKTVEAK